MSEIAASASTEIDPQLIRLTRDAQGRLVFRPEEGAAPVEGVRVARCFPWSCRNAYLSVRDADGHEVCLLRSLDGVPKEARQQIEEELRAQEFLPRITAVTGMDDRFDVMVWSVITDRGPLELQVEHAEDVRQLADGRILIKDHTGGLFDIPDPAALDPRSRAILEDHLT